MTVNILKKTAIAISAFLLSAFFIFAQSLPYEKVAIDGKNFYRYKVKPGESLYSVARTFSISVDQLLKHNPSSSETLQSGATLYIPVNEVNTSPTIDQTHTFYHTVSSGETVYSIARMYNTSVNEIYRFNSDARNGIREGAVLVIPQTKSTKTVKTAKSSQYRYHTILPKETLYGVSRKYQVNAESILAANPGLSTETFDIGKTIRIPISGSPTTQAPQQQTVQLLQHTVKKGETLYSIAKAYNVSVDDIKEYNAVLQSIKIAPNLILSIPYVEGQESTQTVSTPSEVNSMMTKKRASEKVDVMKVGLLLPFLEKKGSRDYQHVRLQEYYEGFLLAVEKMKRKGSNIELYVFDIGTQNNTAKLQSLLETMEMQHLNLIIGGISPNQINLLSDFAQMHQIKYVIPFSSKNTNVLENNQIFQVNSPQSYVHSKATHEFTRRYKSANIIFLNATGKYDKSDFINTLKNDLRKHKIKYNSVNINEDLAASLTPQLAATKENIIVPTVGDEQALRQTIEALTKIQTAQPTIKLRLFGYTEWQTFSKNQTKHFPKFNTTLYTSFYMDAGDTYAKEFMQTFKNWYKRDQLDLYPRFGMLGYDTGLFFMRALANNGTGFENKINNVRANTVQFPFHFERVNNWGGFINTGVYFVEFTPDGSIYKREITQ